MQDILGKLGIAGSLTLNILTWDKVNIILTVIISLLTIVWLCIKLHSWFKYDRKIKRADYKRHFPGKRKMQS